MRTVPPQLTLAYHRPKEHPITKWLIWVYTEARKRMNIELIVTILPSQRASVYSNAGEVDGELGRV